MSTTIVINPEDGNETPGDVAEVVEAVAEVVEAVEEVAVTEPAPATIVDVVQAGQIAHLEAAVEELQEEVAEAQFTADVAQIVADEAIAETSAIIEEAPAMVEEAIEATEMVDTDKDGTVDKIDAPDAAPPGSRTHWLDRSWKQWRGKE